jgi:CHASE3 domain sensor protein
LREQQQELEKGKKEVDEKLKRIQDAKIEEQRQEALKKMEKSQKRKQAEEEIAQIWRAQMEIRLVVKVFN